jgi:hypothetical protein
VLPDQLDSLSIPLSVEVEGGPEETTTLRAVIQVSEALPRERLSAFLRLARGNTLVAWIPVARLDNQRLPQVEFRISVARDFTADSYLEIQVCADAMPAFDGYRLPLSEYARGGKRRVSN